MNKKIVKGDYGYLNSKRQKQFLLFAIGVICVLAFYITGFFMFDGKTNVLTLVAVMAVLPTAKAFVGVYILFPHKALSVEQAQALEKLSKHHFVYDVVLSSEEKIHFLPAVYYKDTTVLFYCNEKNVPLSDLESYVREIMIAKKEGEVCAEVTTVKGFDSFDPFFNRIKSETASCEDVPTTEAEDMIARVFAVFSV